MTRFAALSVATLSALGILAAPAAFAHNAIEQEQPERDSVVTESPLQVLITTNDELLDLGGEGGGNAIAVQDASGDYFGDGCVVLGDTSLGATIPLGEPGLYTLTYQFVGADGHLVSDSYAFTFEPAGSHVPAAGSTTAPRCGEVPHQDTAEPEPTPEESTEPMVIAAPEDQTPATTNPWLIAAGSAVAASALALLVVGLQKRGKR